MPRIRAAALAAQHSDGFAYAPELRIVGVRLEAPFVAEREHLVVHACGVAYAQHVHAAVYELLRNPVDSHVALRAYHHLTLSAQRLVDGFHECCGLARSRRSVHHGYVLGAQHLVHGLLLRGVEPGQTHGFERELLCRRLGVEDVAQGGETPRLGAYHAVEGVEHEAIACLVEEELQSDGLRALQVGDAPAVGQCHDDAVVVGVAHGGCERHILYALTVCLLVASHGEEADGSSRLEVVLYVRVLGARHLHHCLVERVVVAVADGHGEPSVAAPYLALHAHRLGLLSKLLLLVVVFYLEKHSLLL